MHYHGLLFHWGFPFAGSSSLIKADGSSHEQNKDKDVKVYSFRFFFMLFKLIPGSYIISKKIMKVQPVKVHIGRATLFNTAFRSESVNLNFGAFHLGRFNNDKKYISHIFFIFLSGQPKYFFYCINFPTKYLDYSRYLYLKRRVALHVRQYYTSNYIFGISKHK